MNKDIARQRRKMKIRKVISGTSERPRVYVNVTNQYLYVAVTNDQTHGVMASMRGASKNVAAAEEMGKAFGKKLKDLGVTKVVFDRSGFRYHGKIKALADSLRAQGLDF